MVSDQKHAYDPLSDPPIPTYEEATSSLISARRGPQEASDDAERQGLLGHNLSAPSSNSRRRNGYYNPPSAVSDNSGSDDEGSELESPVPEAEDVALRETMEEMDILDPGSVEEGRSRRNRSMNGFSKRFYSIRHSLSSFHLPRIPWPSFDWLTHRLPRISAEYRPGWAILARLCGLILIIILVYFLVVSEIMPIGAGGLGQPFNPEYVRQKVQGSVDTWRIQDNLKYITSFDHVGGTEGSFFLGQWIENKFKEARMDTFAHDEYVV
jgi:N-acetylated-alpha-linked acidic dipeptidase